MFLGLDTRKSRSSIPCAMYLHVSYRGSGSNVFNLMFLGKNSKPTIPTICFSRSSCLKYFRLAHSNKKWFSSSIRPGQKGQKRQSLGVLLCLPVSIASRWLDNLNFVTCDRISVFLYFGEVFLDAYLCLECCICP